RMTPTKLVLSDMQRSIVELAKGSTATIAVAVVEAPRSALQHALTTDPTSAAASKITLAITDRTVVTASRTSVEVHADVGVWRGTIDGRGGFVALSWWQQARMGGMIEHEGHFYSVRYLGEQRFAIVKLDAT